MQKNSFMQKDIENPEEIEEYYLTIFDCMTLRKVLDWLIDGMMDLQEKTMKFNGQTLN